MKKLLTFALVLVMAAGTASLAGCGQKESADFSYWISKAEGQSDYGTYDNNPGVQYITNKTWTPAGSTEGQKIKFEFIVPSSASSPEDAFSTAISSLPDIMELTYSKDSITELYNNGKAMDITEYVEAYMPNYKKYIEDNGLYNVATNVVNGERRYLQLYSYYSSEKFPSWMGYNYRRDWIVEYGKNPSTGTSFTGGYTDGVWSDDVKFPSWYKLTYASGSGCAAGGAELGAWIDGYKQTYTDWQGDYPVTISDWEWMLDIFETAIKAQNISDGYCMSLYNTGFNMTGNLVSSFGGGGVEWYKNTDGTIHFGTGESTFKTYVETMRQWYANGWIDESFQSHTDLFYRTDEQTVVQGRVGLWMGMDSQLFNKLDISGGNASHLTNNICVLGAPYPINDKYGDAENKFQDPYCFYQVSREICQTMITTAAASTQEKRDKLPALFTMLDYMYSEEGAILKGGGLTKEQVAEVDSQMYKKMGLENGLCEQVDGKWVFTEKGSTLTNNQTNVLKPLRMLGLEATVTLRDNPPEYKYTYDIWVRYTNTGRLSESLISQLDSDANKEYQRILTLVREEYSKQVPGFIKGTTSMNNWSSFVLSVSRLGTGNITESLNGLL